MSIGSVDSPGRIVGSRRTSAASVSPRHTHTSPSCSTTARVCAPLHDDDDEAPVPALPSGALTYSSASPPLVVAAMVIESLARARAVGMSSIEPSLPNDQPW